MLTSDSNRRSNSLGLLEHFLIVLVNRKWASGAKLGTELVRIRAGEAALPMSAVAVAVLRPSAGSLHSSQKFLMRLVRADPAPLENVAFAVAHGPVGPTDTHRP